MPSADAGKKTVPRSSTIEMTARKVNRTAEVMAYRSFGFCCLLPKNMFSTAMVIKKATNCIMRFSDIILYKYEVNANVFIRRCVAAFYGCIVLYDLET